MNIAIIIIVIIVAYCALLATHHYMPITSAPTNIYHRNIAADTISNNDYRTIDATTKNLQLVRMSLKPGEIIAKEVHDGTQFIRIESGLGYAMIDNVRYDLYDDMAIIIPPNAEHEIVSVDGLKLYTIYSPPEH